MDLYQSAGSGGSRTFNQHPQRHGAGGFRYTPNGQLTNGPSLFGNTTNLNSVFSSSVPAVFSSSGNQFNFPLRSNRNAGNSGTSNHRTNTLLSSPSRTRGGFNQNHSYGVYSKPSTSTTPGFAHQYVSSGNSFSASARSNPKVRKTQSNREVNALAKSLEKSSINLDPSDGEGESMELQPQYRIFKRGDSYPSQSTSGLTSEENSAESTSNREGTIRQPNSTSEPNSTHNISLFELEQENAPVGTDAASIVTAASATSFETAKSHVNQNKPASNQNTKTPVSIVAEMARFHGLSPVYRLVNETGPPHCPTFTVVLHLGGEEHEGIGSSIKKAQAAAASLALEKSTLPKPPQRSSVPRRNGHSQPWHGQGKCPNWPILQLTALAEEMNQPLHFVNHPVTTINPFRKVTPVTRVAVHIGDRIFSGEGNSFSAAKNLGCMIALKALTKIKKERFQNEPCVYNENEEEDENKSPISVVYEMALKRNMPITYETVKEVGPAHMKVFTVQCKVGEDLTTESDGFTKQQAKKLASEAMIAKLKEVPIQGDSSLKMLHRNLLIYKNIKRKAVAPVVKDMEKASVSPISRLIQIAHLRKYKEPEFSVMTLSTATEETLNVDVQQAQTKLPVRQNRRNPRFNKPHFVIEVKVGPFVTTGEGPNKKAAKKAAADNALILLGYPPSVAKELNVVTSSSTVAPSEIKSNPKTIPNALKIVSSCRSNVPGILVIQNQDADCKLDVSTDLPVILKTEEAGAFSTTTHSPLPSVQEAVSKLSYLAQLLGVQVSYSDFPKKNEYLCVVSLGTSPPHVSHGTGTTLEDARNNAAMQVLNELSDKGIENDGASQDLPKENQEIPGNL